MGTLDIIVSRTVNYNLISSEVRLLSGLTVTIVIGWPQLSDLKKVKQSVEGFVPDLLEGNIFNPARSD